MVLTKERFVRNKRESYLLNKDWDYKEAVRNNVLQRNSKYEWEPLISKRSVINS